MSCFACRGLWLLIVIGLDKSAQDLPGIELVTQIQVAILTMYTFCLNQWHA